MGLCGVVSYSAVASLEPFVKGDYWSFAKSRLTQQWTKKVGYNFACNYDISLAELIYLL